MPESAVSRPLSRFLPAAALLAAAGFWLWLAVGVHTMYVVGGELDHYVERAETLLQGHITTDRLHPMGLSLLIAALGWLGVEPFLGGRLIGIGSGLVLMTCAYRIARLWAGRGPATAAAIAVGASLFVSFCAVQACSDVPAAACVSLALLCWTRAAREARTPFGRLLLGGAALGFAGSLRMPSLAFAPAFAPLAFGVDWRERARRVGWTAVGGVLGLAPHVVTLYVSSGQLFQNTSQIVWKYRYLNNYDAFLAYLDNPTPVSWQELREWLLLGARDWLDYLGTQFGWPWAQATPWLACVLSAWLVLGLVLPFVLRRRAAAVLACGAWSYSVLLCVLSVPLDRLTIPMAVPAVVLATLAWVRVPPSLRLLPAGIACALAGLAVAQLPASVAYFSGLHARAEMAATRELIAANGEWITVTMPSVGVERGLPCFVDCFLPSEDVAAAAPTYWDRLRANPKAAAARFVVVGPTWPGIHAEMAAAPLPDGYARLRTGEVLVFERQDAVGWLERAGAEHIGDELHLSLRLAPDVDRAKVAGAGFMLRVGDRGEWQPLVLPPAPDGGFALVLACDPAAASERWTFVPAVMSWDGSKRTGAPVVVAAPGRLRTR